MSRAAASSVSTPFAYREAARERLPAATWDFLEGGAGEEATVRANEAAWQAPLRPRTFVDVSTVSTAGELLGGPLATPILLAPVGRQRAFHPDGEEASAAAAAAQGTVFCLSATATTDLHQLAGRPGRRWLQIYLGRDRGAIAAMVAAARDCGYERLVLTADLPVHATRPRSLRHGSLGPLPPGVGLSRHRGDGSTRADAVTSCDPAMTWADLEWLAGLGLPVAVKGIVRDDDAERCLEHGADALIVSNHGGRQLDGCLTGAAALPEIAARVGGRAPLLVDGGLRDGRAVLRALALGADAVLVGRPYIWGLAAGGEEGVAEVLATLTTELREAMTLCGAPTVAAIGADLLAGGSSS
ncbi:MAG: alpha-hydroxy-acid oxidizing protein [Actinobacteria bacterium]|nr:alpha-hydroxy-acid oxidizing protein [Actinomycetota bacterium]